jgi:hypothetical protein
MFCNSSAVKNCFSETIDIYLNLGVYCNVQLYFP